MLRAFWDGCWVELRGNIDRRGGNGNLWDENDIL